jgi:cytochrome P450
MNERKITKVTEVATIPAHVPESLVFDFDYFLPGGVSAPIPTAAVAQRLHGIAPDIFYTPRNGGHWAITRAADGAQVASNYEVFSSAPVFNDWKKQLGTRFIPLHYDPPEHGPLRRMFNVFFTPSRVRQMEEDIRVLVRSLIDAFKADGQCEFVAQLSNKFPLIVFLNIVGAPLSDLERLSGIVKLYLRSSERSESLRGFGQMLDYVKEMIELRRRSPGEDLVSHILASAPDGRPLDEEEILGAVQLFFLAGLDTVTSVVGSMMLFLARNPQKYAEIVNNPVLIPTAMEELLRISAPATTDRAVRQDLDYNGVPFRQGDRVVMLTQLFGFDPRQTEDPFDVRFDRKAKQLAFGVGPHNCLGAHLARQEMRIFLQEWIASIPAFSLAPNADPKLKGGNVWAPELLPLIW